MSSLPALSTPLDSLNASRALTAGDAIADNTTLKSKEDTQKVAQNFEALLIHNMLKSMRSTTLGEKPSNGLAMYNDMYDQQLSKVLSESGGLGIASSISRQLNLQNGISEVQPELSHTALENSIHAMSNHPNTLARNSQLTSELHNISEYQALMNRSKPTIESTTSSTGSIGIAMIKSTEANDEIQFSGDKKQFVDTLLPDAKLNAARLGIQPATIIAIAALETGWGKFVVKDNNGNSSHNLFGIKAHGMNTPYTMHKTTEYIDNKAIKTTEPFRQYKDVSSAVSGFADFLLENPRYETALNSHSDKHLFIRELQQAGYATDPEYANKVIDVLKQVESIQQGSAL